ncbi:hypothetical protein [Rudaeicoccus suwonensis]|uniref:hypothetical protein n=1 Tax=Rudaeicoccus suwonensis TaxID=657409 RepID=UPI00119E8530|nr:hypothetical protein [Rudaeicoccus suwonensis]
MPRYHQDDRGPAREPYAFHQVAPEGAYSKIPAWTSRAQWLGVDVPITIACWIQKHGALRVRRPDGRDGAPVSVQLLRRYLTVRSGWAQQRTGRRCIVRPDTIASVLGVDVGTVHRAQNVARRLGLEVVIETGRMLTKAEKLALWNRAKTDQVPCSRQRGLSTEVAFTNPLARQRNWWIATPGSTPPYLTFISHQITGYLHSNRAASGSRKDAAPPRQPQKHSWRPAARSVAADLAHQWPWLAAEHPSRLLPTLARFVRCPRPWTAAQLAGVVDDQLTRAGYAGIRAARFDSNLIRTRPAVVLAGLLRDIDPDTDHPDHAFHDEGAAAAEAADPRPYCARDDCDHGWLTRADPDYPGTAWRTTVWDDGLARRCPGRHRRHTEHDAELEAGYIDDVLHGRAEPPF